MNARLKALTGMGVAGLIAIIALHGRAFIDALAGVPVLLNAFASQAPLGTGSFFLAIGISAALCAFLLRWLPHGGNDTLHHFVAECAALATGVLVMCLQFGQHPERLLSAIWLGLLAGFSAPLLVRGVRALLSTPAGKAAAKRVVPPKQPPAGGADGAA